MRRRDVMIGALAAVAAAGIARTVGATERPPIGIDTLTSADPAATDGAALLAAGMAGTLLDLDIWPRSPDPAESALKAWAEAEAAPGSRLRVIRADADFDAAAREERFGVVLHCQDATILGNNEISYADSNLDLLRAFYGLGLRGLQLTHNMRNGLGDGFQEDRDGGLSVLGCAVVAEMGRLGMLIDLSHCGPVTTDQTLALATRPVAITHAGCRALFDSGRNKTDATIRALADKGGYFGIYSMSRWLTARPTSSVQDVVDHIDHAVNVGGLQTVGFGSDQPPMGDPMPQADKVAVLAAYQARNLGRAGAEPLHGHVTCADLDGPDRMRRLDQALARRGYASAAREAILGGNFRRVFRAACG